MKNYSKNQTNRRTNNENCLKNRIKTNQKTNEEFFQKLKRPRIDKKIRLTRKLLIKISRKIK